MNDEPDFDLWLRASAYLDGELDAAERARAEADPRVMAEVQALRALQDDLRDVEPPTGAARQAAISAALREFDAIHAAPAVHTYGIVRPIRARRSWSGLLGAVAAAVVIIAALGFVVSGGLDGDDDDAGVAGDADLADESFGTTRSLDQSAIEVGAQAPVAEATAEAVADAAAEEAVTAGGADAPAATMPTAVLSAGTTAAASASPAPPSSFVFDPAQPIVGEGQLAAAGAQLQEQQRRGELVNTPETHCGTIDESRPFEVLSDGFYTDATGTTVPVLIAIDPASGDTLALDPDSCAVIAAAPRQ